MNKDKIKITYWVSTDNVGSRKEYETEIDKENWEEMSDREKDGFIFDKIVNASAIEYGYYIK